MKVIWALTKKEMWLLLRDPIALVLLLVMPLLFTLVQGLLVGETFGRKPEETLRISLVDLDQGTGLHGKSWGYWVLQDLKETPGIRIELIPSRAEAQSLIRSHQRSAVLVLNEDFSDRINHCSFLDTPGSINPFHREGVFLDPDDPNNTQHIDLGLKLLKDRTQVAASSIIEQVVQVCMLRVVLPYMIGQAFQKLTEPAFIDRLGQEVRLPVPEDFPVLYNSAEKLLKDPKVRAARVLDRDLDATLKKLEGKLSAFKPLADRDRVQLAEMLQMAAGKDPKKAAEYQAKVGEGVQKALERQFSKYDLTGMTWAALTRSQGDGPEAPVDTYVDRTGNGLLSHGARYQQLVPAFTVMFAFFLVLVVGWIFVTERRQGTLARLRAAPITRGQILLGKLIPWFVMSLLQGVLLLVAGRLLFGFRWGPDNWSLAQQAGWLFPVVFCTSLAAMGLALLVAAIARTEVQVALFGGVPVVVLALMGGCLLPREMMPEPAQKLSLLTPHGWALSAYRELLPGRAIDQPDTSILLMACGVLAAFGAGFLALAWGLLRLD